jgi:ABC-type transport system involved in multi-copper enzyme maturation permease subunit
MFSFLASDLFSLPPWLADNLPWVIPAAIVVLGLAIFGIPDLLRFSVKRIWAISGVCYQESIRRRVLWIIPLAILGLVVVVQIQQPLDEQDAIRETTKFCLFATGMVVVISTIILACTNLPREIENRVIFTVVSKPTTRLEIILGKITGFARVSATILLIMGLFSYGYLHLRAWNLERDLRERLRLNAVENISRPTFQHYVDAGLLNAKRLANPDAMNVYGKLPVPGSTKRYPTVDGMILVPFHIPPDMMASVAADEMDKQSIPGMLINVRVGFDLTPRPVPPSPMAPVKAAPTAASGPARVSIAVMDQNANNILTSEVKGAPALIPTADGTQSVTVEIAPASAALLTKYPFIFIALANPGGDARLWIDDDPAHRPDNPPVTLSIPVLTAPDKVSTATVLPSDPTDPAKPAGFVFTGREGVIGQQVKGDPKGDSQVCVFSYNGLDIQHRSGDTIPIEFRVGVEKSGDIRDQDVPTDATLTVINSKTGKSSAPIPVQPENNRPFYASVPADSVEGGRFQVVVRCLSPDQWINVKRNSLSIVQAEDSFALNLFKSGLVLWLLSILVTTISVFCSTFLSWPIAVMLTLVMLLGRWGVNQLGDAATAGIGRQISQDFQIQNITESQVFAGTVEDLNKALKAVASVLPDIERFAATDNIDRGISIPNQTLINAGAVLVLFGLPLTVLSYIFLKNKEVAP